MTVKLVSAINSLRGVRAHHMCGPDISQLVVPDVFPNLDVSHDLWDLSC